MSQLKELRDRRAKIVRQGEQAVTDLKGVDASDAEAYAAAEKVVTDAKSDLDAVNAAIDQAERLADAERAFVVTGDGHVGIEGGELAAAHDPKRGFRNAGEFAMAVYNGSRAGADVDPRLKIGAAPTSYTNQGSGADGGYLIPPEFSTRIYEHSLEENAFLPMTDNDDVSGNGMSFPADETTPWGSDGVRAYWEGEADQGSQTKVSTKTKDLRLNKLFALVPVTDEMLSDSSVINSYIERKSGSSIRWKTQDAFMNGTGAGQPEGVFGSGALVTQAKEGSQTADTINANNVAKMFARNLNPGRAVWVINPDAYPQLPVMTVGDQPVWTPNFQQSSGGLLLGRPVIMSDTCQTLGDKGDIFFIDWQGYKTITKAGGIETATSMHLWFDYGVSAFRATFRVDGQPWHSAAVTPPNSSVTRSSFVTLAARA